MNRTGWAPSRLGSSAFLPAVKLSAAPQPTLGTSRYTLGQTAREWYDRALAAVAQWEFLMQKLNSIDSKQERQNISAWVGDPGTEGTPAHRYARVKWNATGTVAAEGVGAYNDSTRQGRVEELEAYNKELEDKIETALEIHGVRQTEVRTETRVVESYRTPILIGAGIIAATILVAAVA